MWLLLDQMQDTVKHGARGGQRLGERGAFVQPAILTDVTASNPAYRQEFFGPAAIVYSARNEVEAVAIANDSPFGLGGSIYARILIEGAALAARSSLGWCS
jgi:succinate-semialdehyde dehydrogenase/glutarate-semialdehyde dehydrogenase